MVNPVKLKAVAPAPKTFDPAPAQVPPAAPPTAIIFESVSVNEAFVNAPVVLLFDKVKVTTDCPPDEIVVGANAFPIVGGAITVRFAVLLAVPTVVCVVVTPLVVFCLMPAVLLVTSKVTVQVLFAGIVMPLKLKAVAPAAKVAGVASAQVPPTTPPAAVIPVSVSVNEAFVSAVAFVLPKVSVTVELPPI